MSAILHPDFGGLRILPGEAHTTGPRELYDLINVVSVGGAVDRATHIPTELGSVGPRPPEVGRRSLMRSSKLRPVRPRGDQGANVACGS